MVSKQGLAPIGEGNCVFLYSGHGDIWHPSLWDTFDAAEKAKRVAAFNACEPGFGISACEYMAERKIILWGGDTWATEDAYEFLFVWSPLKIKGGTGSPGNPIALY